MVILLPLLDLFVFHFSCAKYTNSIHIKRKFLKQRRSYWYGPDHLLLFLIMVEIFYSQIFLKELSIFRDQVLVPLSKTMSLYFLCYEFDCYWLVNDELLNKFFFLFSNLYYE